MESLKSHIRTKVHSNVGNVKDLTYADIVHLRMKVQDQLITFREKKQWFKYPEQSLEFMQHWRNARKITSQMWLNLQIIFVLLRRQSIENLG